MAIVSSAFNAQVCFAAVMAVAVALDSIGTRLPFGFVIIIFAPIR